MDLAITKSIRRSIGLRVGAEGKFVATADQTEILLNRLTSWRREVYSENVNFLALDAKMQGTILHASVANRMRRIDLDGLRINERIYGQSPYVSPVTGDNYSYRIPDYYHVNNNVIYDIKPAGAPLSGSQFEDFKSFANTDDVRWIFYNGFR